MSNLSAKIIETSFEAAAVAREWAQLNDVNESRCQALAEVWHDAGKDPEQSTARALCSYLKQKTLVS